MWNTRCWLPLPCAIAGCLAVCLGLASAHDLEIDQLVLWPEPDAGILRGEITFDPELTRSKDAIVSERDQVRVRALLADQIRVEVDGDELSTNLVIRELWSPGGATAGDIVVFTAALPPESEHLRAFVGSAFDVMVVSVQVPRPGGGSEAWSALVSGGDYSPRFPLASPPAAGQRWQQGGPEQFWPSQQRSGTPGDAGTTELGGDRMAIARRFVELGYVHILPKGLDHLLFVAGLVLGAARRTKQIVISITLFTLAHTVSLALTRLGGWHAPPNLVEPLIALSIILIGFDNLRVARPGAGQVPEAGAPQGFSRYGLVFGFGLLHGLGFANALAELSFAREQLTVALLAFNVGVELGQLTLAVGLILALQAVRDPVVLWRRIVAPGSVAIAIAGFIFMLDRLLQ